MFGKFVHQTDQELVYFDSGLKVLKTLLHAVWYLIKNCPWYNQKRAETIKAIHCHASNAL